MFHAVMQKDILCTTYEVFLPKYNLHNLIKAGLKTEQLRDKLNTTTRTQTAKFIIQSK